MGWTAPSTRTLRRDLVKGNKNDGNDAQAIVEAAQRPTMRFVPVKTIEQQDIQSLHRARSRLVNDRTGLVSQMRAILAERGIVFPKSITRARRQIPLILADQDKELSAMTRSLLVDLLEQLSDLDRRIGLMDRRILCVFRTLEPCQRLAKISGVGPMTATAMVAAIGDGSDFNNGRHLAAWLGLVPRQHASGDRNRLYGISKRGDKHLRTMLIHGARAVVRTAPAKTDARHQWVQAVRERRGVNRTIVAVANKNARIIWSLLAKNQRYRVVN
jgi:transposase